MEHLVSTAQNNGLRSLSALSVFVASGIVGHYVFLIDFKFVAVFGVDFLSGFRLVWLLLIILNFLFFPTKSWLMVNFDLAGLLVLGSLELLVFTALIVDLVLIVAL